MEEKKKHHSLLHYVNVYMRNLFSLRDDKAPEEETIASIRAGVEFRGATLWILIFAIFVASLGLNTNSAAVIIGAMLISPLMGPIVGMGLGIGINDFEMLKRAFKNFSIATLFSVLTATFYFAITPIAEAQSELLARTSPTIYDVLIAFFGGMGGIVALCSTGQRGGNVIPGVAIATALMPPLCTTGFGIATGNWLYAAGAFYLYLINSIFISLATFIGVRILDFNKKVFVDKAREKRVKHIIITITVLTILPAAFLTFLLVQENIYMQKANQFVSKSIASNATQVITKDINYREREIRIVTIGEELSEDVLKRIHEQLDGYGLQGTKLSIVQGSKNLDEEELKDILNTTNSKQIEANAQLLANEQQRANRLEKQLQPYLDIDKQAAAISHEMRTLFPEAWRLSIARSLSFAVSDTTAHDTITFIYLTLQNTLPSEDEVRLEKWIKERLNTQNIMIHKELINENDK